MILSSTESKLFFKLYKPLLNFARPVKKGTSKEYHKSKAMLYANPSLFLEFIVKNPLNFDISELKIINNWQKYISGDFIFLKQLKKYAIFHRIGENTPNIYGVSGLTDPFMNIVKFTPMCLNDVVLLPFANKIVCDGLFNTQKVILGKNYSHSFNKSYREARLNKSIIETIK